MVELVGRGLHGGHEDAGGPCRRLNVGRAAASAAGRRPPSTLFNSEDKPASPRKLLTVIFVDGGGPSRTILDRTYSAQRFFIFSYYLRAVGRKVLWSAACVCLCVCFRTVFVRKISQERVHGSPPNLVGGSRG